VNPISKVTSAVAHPIQTATTVASHALGVAASGARTTMRIIDRAAGQGRAGSPGPTWSPTPEATPPPAPPASPAPATKGPAKKAATKKAPAKKSPARKTAAKKAPSARAATAGPALSRTERESVEADDLRTPSGIPAADEAHNPDTAETDLHQPGTEPLMDPATVKAAKSEAEVMQRAAEVDKG
jgi:hypothetical protein